MVSCQVNQIFLGEVCSIQNYGAFVKIPGCAQQGMIHKSQVSSAQVDDVAEVLQRGERVWCKIISINEDGKISLSMKFVNQGNGKDLDPNNVQLDLEQQKRKQMNYSERKKAIVLGAVYKTTCSKCKTPGHLAKDCFTTPDGKKYELIPESDEETVIKSDAKVDKVENTTSTKKKSKSKKSKKRKHSDLEQDSDDDESSDSKSRSKKKKKKVKKHKKSKKKKRHDTSSDSDSSASAPSKNKSNSKKHKS